MIRSKAIFLVFLISTLTVTPCAATDAPKEETLQVTEIANSYELSVPISRLLMTIPKGSLLPKQNTVGGSTDSPRYFYFEDKRRALIASGWFESSREYSTFNQNWNDEKNSWRSRNFPVPINEKFFKLGGWEAVAYDMPLPTGGNSHIRAHWVQAGTWIDLHLSLTSETSSSGSREKLLELLKSIQVKQRP